VDAECFNQQGLKKKNSSKGHIYPVLIVQDNELDSKALKYGRQQKYISCIPLRRAHICSFLVKAGSNATMPVQHWVRVRTAVNNPMWVCTLQHSHATFHNDVISSAVQKRSKEKKLLT
jgi:hypothetical protein